MNSEFEPAKPKPLSGPQKALRKLGLVRPIDLALRYEDETRLVRLRDMLARYMTLSLADRKTVCDVVAALAVAATVKSR